MYIRNLGSQKPSRHLDPDGGPDEEKKKKRKKKV